jgi:hypothetical protein
VANSGKDIRAVFFDFLTAAAAVAELAAVEFVINEVRPEMKASRACPCDSPAV